MTLLRALKNAKLPAGPMAADIPGPTFDRQESEAVNEVMISVPSNDSKMENKADEEKTLAYTIFEGTSDAVTEKVFTSAEYTAVGDKTDLTINITAEDWQTAYAGEYSDTVTFNVEYTDAAPRT